MSFRFLIRAFSYETGKERGGIGTLDPNVYEPSRDRLYGERMATSHDSVGDWIRKGYQCMGGRAAWVLFCACILDKIPAFCS